MLREPQHERQILNDIQAPSVRPEHCRRTPTEFFSSLLENARSAEGRITIRGIMLLTTNEEFYKPVHRTGRGVSGTYTLPEHRGAACADPTPVP